MVDLFFVCGIGSTGGGGERRARRCFRESRLAAWFRPTLSADEQAAVLADRDEHPDPVIRRKMLVLWAVHLGHPRQQVAIGVATAKRYRIAYRDGGLDGLRRREPHYRPTSQLADHADAIRQSLTERPARTTAEPIDRIHELPGLRRGLSQTRTFLAGLGFTWQRTRADAGGEPWLFAIEFQLEPDPLMFGRMLQYLGILWEAVKPDGGRGSRFAPVGVVVNLTGTGGTSRSHSWPAAGVNTTLGVRERNSEAESADDLLGRIDTGAVGRAVLPWVPLLDGAGEPSIVERWKALAEAEPDDRRRSNSGGLALVFC